MMGENMSRIIVNTVVKKAIRDLKSDPERTIRNLVDMALQFADSRIQEEFYSSAQKLLSDETSGYYALVKDSVTKVDEDALLTFCMNLGFNGLYQGAAVIREQEQNLQCSIPWTVSLMVTEGKICDCHHALIRQGEAMGIHVWHLFSDHGIHECLSLAANYPQSAFVIFCSCHELDTAVIEFAKDIRNIALVVPFDADSDVTCSQLREAGLLYGLYYAYSQKDLPKIESGELLEDMQQLYPVISILKPQFSCEDGLRKQVYDWITKARIEQKLHTIPWELYSDTLLVDSIISESPCWVGFDEYGQLYTDQGVDRTYGLNIFINQLSEVLKKAFPRTNQE